MVTYFELHVSLLTRVVQNMSHSNLFHTQICLINALSSPNSTVLSHYAKRYWHKVFIRWNNSICIRRCKKKKQTGIESLHNYIGGHFHDSSLFSEFITEFYRIKNLKKFGHTHTKCNAWFISACVRACVCACVRVCERITALCKTQDCLICIHL